MRLVFVGESDLDHMGGAMTSAIFSDGRPMSEEEFLAIGETPERIELFDGSLHVTPAPTFRHQRIAGRLFGILDRATENSGLEAHQAINLRLQPGRVPIPDLAVTTELDPDGSIADAAAVLLVCEITSPSNAATDRVLKMHYYAAAGVPWYLLIEQDSCALALHHLVDGTYVLDSLVPPGKVLELVEPVVVTIDPEELLPRR